MLAPQRMRGCLGASDARFRVLLCRCTPGWCGRHWSANGADQLLKHLAERDQHESLCRTGVLAHTTR